LLDHPVYESNVNVILGSCDRGIDTDNGKCTFSLLNDAYNTIRNTMISGDIVYGIDYNTSIT